METLLQLRDRFKSERPSAWDGLPDLALYMDQIISYMPRQLIQSERDEVLTPAMVNNYIKAGLLPRADGKKYGREHLAYLTAICALKQVLSVREMSILLGEAHNREIETLYGYFQTRLDAALMHTVGALDEPSGGRGDLALLALTLSLRSYADKLACQRVLTVLENTGPDQKTGGIKHE